MTMACHAKGAFVRCVQGQDGVPLLLKLHQHAAVIMHSCCRSCSLSSGQADSQQWQAIAL